MCDVSVKTIVFVIFVFFTRTRAQAAQAAQQHLVLHPALARSFLPVSRYPAAELTSRLSPMVMKYAITFHKFQDSLNISARSKSKR